MKHQLPTIHSSLTEEDWQDLRRSRFTASEIHKLMGTPKTKSEFLSETAKSFVFEKAAEYLTGNRTEIYGRALDWGKEHEKEAFHYFQQQTDEGGEDMYVVWDNTRNQDEIGSYDDEPEFESEDPAEVAAFLKSWINRFHSSN